MLNVVKYSLSFSTMSMENPKWQQRALAEEGKTIMEKKCYPEWELNHNKFLSLTA